MDDFSNMVFAVFDAVIYLNRACRGIDYGYYQGDKRLEKMTYLISFAVGFVISSAITARIIRNKQARENELAWWERKVNRHISEEWQRKIK
jgi:tellurite resistance protein TehA-like permease